MFRATSDQAPVAGRWYPWISMGVAFFGTFLAIVNTTSVNVLLPGIAADLDVEWGLEWVATSYLVAVGVSQPAAGWFMERLGRRWTYVLGLTLFTVGSAAVSLAPSLGLLLAARALQGLGGGILLPVAMAVVFEAFPPHRRGTAMGIWGIALMAGPAVGPVLGGWVATLHDWRLLYLLNIPVGLLGIAMSVWLLRDGDRRADRRLDFLALVLVGFGVAGLLYALSTSEGTLGVLEAGVALASLLSLGLFVWRQLRADHPLIEVRMFTIPTFRRALLLGWLLMFVQHARLFLVPLELQSVRGSSALEAGLVLAPAAIGTAMFMPVGGRLTDRIGPRVPIVVGTILMAAGVLLLGRITVDTSLTTVIWMQVVQGVGAGLALLPLTLAALSAVPTSLVPQASSVRALNQQLAAAVGVTILAAVLVVQVGVVASTTLAPEILQAAYNRAFQVALVGVVLGLPLALRMPGRHENREIQRARADEQPQGSS